MLWELNIRPLGPEVQLYFKGLQVLRKKRYVIREYTNKDISHNISIYKDSKRPEQYKAYEGSKQLHAALLQHIAILFRWEA